MKQLRYYAALAIRVIAFIWQLPSMLMYDLSNIIKNKEDKFNF